MSFNMKYKHVIWDWNGTLLDDVKLGHELLNLLQKKKGLIKSSFDEYKKMFTFPITEFYKRAGLYESEEAFYELASIFIKKYDEGVKDSNLHNGTKKVLGKLIRKGITNSILTASLESMALKQLDDYEIREMFIEVTGKEDYFASGKSELISQHISKIGYEAKDIVFIGDTLHDMEIANLIGCDYIIVGYGHQDISYASQDKINAVYSLEEVLDIILCK